MTATPESSDQFEMLDAGLSDPGAPKPITDAARQEIVEAKSTLEHTGLADRLTEAIGAPITASIAMLPDVAEGALAKGIDSALRAALEVAIKTLGEDKPHRPAKLGLHKFLATLSGAAGGSLGLATAAAELPVSTCIILRSIADIARAQGEDLTSVEARLACLEVFALDGGSSEAAAAVAETNAELAAEADAIPVSSSTEIGYLAVRVAMAKQIGEASKFLVTNGLSNTAAPPVLRLIGMISQRFGVVVSEKLAAQAVPVIGAVGGALINTYFIDHYQDLARAHFTIRRLEREHGTAAVHETYASL